jgi:hypothetical protein
MTKYTMILRILKEKTINVTCVYGPLERKKIRYTNRQKH